MLPVRVLRKPFYQPASNTQILPSFLFSSYLSLVFHLFLLSFVSSPRTRAHSEPSGWEHSDRKQNMQPPFMSPCLNKLFLFPWEQFCFFFSKFYFIIIIFLLLKLSGPETKVCVCVTRFLCGRNCCPLKNSTPVSDTKSLKKTTHVYTLVLSSLENFLLPSLSFSVVLFWCCQRIIDHPPSLFRLNITERILRYTAFKPKKVFYNKIFCM